MIRSININVIPSFGHIVNVSENDKNKVVIQIILRSMKLINGEKPKEPFILNLETLILLGMLHLAFDKL
jgi:hypothetical protein